MEPCRVHLSKVDHVFEKLYCNVENFRQNGLCLSMNRREVLRLPSVSQARLNHLRCDNQRKKEEASLRSI